MLTGKILLIMMSMRSMFGAMMLKDILVATGKPAT